MNLHSVSLGLKLSVGGRAAQSAKPRVAVGCDMEGSAKDTVPRVWIWASSTDGRARRRWGHTGFAAHARNVRTSRMGWGNGGIEFLRKKNSEGAGNEGGGKERSVGA